MSKKSNQKQTIKNPRWSKPTIYIIILAVINILVFSRTSSFDFVLIDDNVLIYENPLITNSRIPISEVFESKKFSPHYKPLTFLTWKLQYNNVGAKPSAFHTVNWILHVLNTILLFLIGIKLFEKIFNERKQQLIAAFILALLFSINPLRIESVAWAIERKDVLFSFFFFLSWYAYLYYIQQKKYLFLIIGAVLFLLSGLSKSMGITLITVLFLTDLWFNRKIYSKTILEKIPYFLSFGILIYLYGFLNSTKKVANSALAVTETSGKISNIELIDNLPFVLQWLLSASLRFVLWIVHSLIPIKLSVDYSYDAIFRFFSFGIFLFPLIVITLFYYAWKVRKTKPIILGGLLFFGLTISPVLVYSQSGQGAFLADRYTYIPSIGLFFIVVYLLSRIKDSTKQVLITGAIIVFFLGSTLINIGNWKNSQTLFTQVLNVNPKSSLAYLNLGRYYRENGKANEAIRIYSRGINLAKSSDLYSNRGKIYFDQNNIDLAIIDFNKSLKIDPNNTEALANRGAVYGMKQDWTKSFADLNRALEIDPNNLNAISNLGMANYSQQNFDKAITHYKKYLSIESNEPDIINTIALCYAQLGQYDKAIKEYTKAIKIKSNVGAYFLNRSLTYNQKGDKANALKDAERAKRLGTKVSSSYINGLKQ
jgi:tetratricopeptide (TPR) repeat protein